MAKRKKAERPVFDTHEIARAVRDGSALANAKTKIVYSLSNTGTVFSAMTFVGVEFRSGSKWQARERGVSVLDFVAMLDAFGGFRFRISRKPEAKRHRVNYTKALRVGSEGF